MAIEDVDLAEFARCRDEIDNRTEISEKLVLGQLTVWGLGISALDKYPDVLLGLSTVTSFIWIFWLAHTQQISKLACYIACHLAPRLREHSDKERVLGWEEYSRIMKGAGAYNLPYPPKRSTAGDVSGAEPLNVARCILWLFAGATPVFLSMYWIIAVKKGLIATLRLPVLLDLSNLISDARVLMMVISLVIWFIAIGQYRLIHQIWKAIDEKVVEMAYSDNATSKTESAG